MSDNNEFIEQEIDSLFEDARQELARVDENAKELKKNIVINLAKKLEEKIPTDTISIEIATQLQGQVSDRFIRECLDEKYKQKHKVENAKKQKKEQEGYNNLAAVTPLDNKEEDQKNKEVILVDADSRSTLYMEEDEDEKSSQTESEVYSDSAITDKSLRSSSSFSQQKVQEHQIEEHDERFDSNESEHQNHNDLNDQNFEEIDVHEEPNPLTYSVNKEMIIEDISSELFYANDKDVLSFKFPINRKDIQDYLSIVDVDVIWNTVTINTRTKEVIHYFGRQSQQNVAEKSSRNDTATANTIGKNENE